MCYLASVDIDLIVMPESSSRKAPVAQGLIPPGSFAFIVLQLVLLAIAIRQFRIESPAFLRLAFLAFGGFVIHAFLPLKWRLPFFVGLSFAAIFVVLGIATGAWVIGLGLILIGICHLPMRLRYRAGLLVGVGIFLAVQRTGLISSPWSQAVWPILGSMFMFRLIVYLYDLEHETVPPSPSRTLGYFFLLPNVCFPLFPVVDYKTFRRNYYDDEAARIYQIGVDWMARGVIHLILYRVVYYYFVIAPAEVQDVRTFTQFVVANFLLYLRVSGQFHLIVGMLYLFGFRLPETHHKYFLSSSFTDFWRRINIYWKDFMLKIFYYPLYFKLKSFGPTRALVISTFVVFFATWALHTYQWFWLRGKVLLAWTDAAFWTILSVLVVINALYEMRHGRVRSLGPGQWSWRQLGGKVLRIVGTFVSISLLWSLWTSESFSSWFAIWGAIGDPKPAGAAGWIPGMVVAAAVVAGDIVRPGRGAPPPGAGGFWSRVRWSTVTTIISLILLAALGVQEIYTKLGPKAATVINSLRSGQLSRVDNVMLERGYYEELVRVDRFNNQLWEVYMNKPANWLDVKGLGLEQFRDDFLQKELVPSRSVQTRLGPIRTNRWGMRDKDYELKPAPGTYRIALLGASTVMGWGVGDNEVFEAIVEDRLNRERPGNRSSYEILNFAVPGYEPLQQLVVLEKAWKFSPNAIMHIAAGREQFGAVQNLATSIRKGIPIPYAFLRDVAKRAGVDAGTDETTAMRRLEPFGGEILSWVYREMVQACKQRKVVPILVFLPHTSPGIWESEADEVIRRAEEAGFVVINLKRAYQGIDPESLRLAEWDAHPTVRGHQIIAHELYEGLSGKANIIFIPREDRP